MMRYVIDPVTLVRLADERITPEGQVQLVAPNSLRSEALSLLLDSVREGRMDEREALSLHDRMTGYKIRLLGDRVSRARAWSLALAHGWEDLGDAQYIAVTLLQADALVAGDIRLAQRAAGTVALAGVDALTQR